MKIKEQDKTGTKNNNLDNDAIEIKKFKDYYIKQILKIK